MEHTAPALSAHDAQSIKDALLRNMPTDPAEAAQELIRAFALIDRATATSESLS